MQRYYHVLRYLSLAVEQELASGMHQSEFLDLALMHRPIELHGCCLVELTDDRAVHRWTS
jgi:hypothetical protein